jgi:hypothetical protein
MSAPKWADPNCRFCGAEIKHKPGRGRPRVRCGAACDALERHYRRIRKPFRGGACKACGEAWWENRYCACERALVAKARETRKRRAA